TMPQLGESVTEGTVEKWLKAEGELVRRDEPLVEVVTDKVNAEVPSPFEGRLVRIHVTEGTTVPIGAALAELEVQGVEAEAEVEAGPAAAAPPPAAPATASTDTASAPPASPVAATPGQREELVRVSAVRRQIADHMVRSKHVSPHAWGMREVDMSALVTYREA